VTSGLASELRGEAQLVSPFGSWEMLGPWTQGFSVAPGASAVLRFAVHVPLTARHAQSWALVKVMYYGRVRYTEAIPVVIGPVNDQLRCVRTDTVRDSSVPYFKRETSRGPMQSATAILTGNLPAEPNSFIGRERDLAELARLLGEVRALTLSGLGGIGKTRLAVRLARDVLSGESPDADEGPRDLDEAWLVELADWHGPVAQAVATTLGVREEQGVPLAQTLAEALRSRHMLLILDTCEYQVSDCATLVQLLMARCPWLRIIATSREPLRVRGETVWRVPPLDLPPDGASGAELAAHEAVRLFAARAAGARPGFTLTSENTASVARLCRTLDGIPLGIELSAARVRALSVEQIADRLRDRFQLLNSGDRTAPLRQQTLRATVDWSFELLDSDEQMLLRRLATFSGWNLDMAEQVCSDEAIGPDAVLGLLISLIDKSLVVLDGEAAGDARYRLLDTIREYAAERLEAAGESDALALRHRDCILTLVEETVGGMFNRGEPPWPVRREVYRRGIAEYGNFRIALQTSLAHGHADEGLRLCIGLRNMWLPHGDAREAATWLDRFLVLPDAEVSPPVRGPWRSRRERSTCRTTTRWCAARPEPGLSRASGDDPIPTALRVISQRRRQAAGNDAVSYRGGGRGDGGQRLGSRADPEPQGGHRRPAGKLKSAQRAERPRWRCWPTTTAGASHRCPTGWAPWPGPAATPRWRSGTTPTRWRSSASSTPGRRSPAARPGWAGSRLPPVTTTRRRRAWPRRCG
jgi:predicted ATPase